VKFQDFSHPASPLLNVEEIKRKGRSLPQDIHWGHLAYCMYLGKHTDYKITEGDILIFVVGHFPVELTSIPLEQCFSTPSPRTQMSPWKALAESASTGDMQVSVMPSDNNNFAVSHGIYTFDVVSS